MSVHTLPNKLIVLVLCSILTTAANAQTAQPGSCLLPSGEWCWPLVPATYGDPCQCQTPDGPVAGVIQ